MTFKVIDTKTGKEPTDRVIHNIAKSGGLMTMDIDQFFVGEDGALVLADDCGNITYCDTKRFMVVAESEMGHCKDCKYFEYDSVAKVDGIPLIVAHEICSRWGDGCKTREDGYCFLFEPQESEG